MILSPFQQQDFTIEVGGLHWSEDLQLEEARNIVDDGEGNDGDDVVLGGPLATDSEPGVADGEVALHCQRQGQQDRPCTCIPLIVTLYWLGLVAHAAL